MAKRKSTGKKSRFEVFKRDKFTCQYCGAKPPSVTLVVDHLLPVAKGGGNEISNLITACETCNQGKSDGTLSEAPEPIRDSLAKQIESQQQLREYNEWLMQAREEIMRGVRALGIFWCNLQAKRGEENKWQVTTKRLVTLRTFAEKLPLLAIEDAMCIAHSRKPVEDYKDGETWAYFCGICWNKVRESGGGDRG